MKVQHPSTVVDVAKMKHVPHREGIGPTAPAPRKTAMDVEIATAMAAKNLEGMDVANPEAVERIFRGLGSKRYDGGKKR